MRYVWQRACALFFACMVSCVFHGCGLEKNKALSLQFFDQVYVPVDMMTFMNMDAALKEYGYGNVTTKNSKTVYTYAEREIEASNKMLLVIYTDVSFLPSGSAFQPMRVWQCYELALSDDNAQGIIVNPDAASARSYAMSKDEIKTALPKLPRKEALAWSIQIMQ